MCTSAPTSNLPCLRYIYTSITSKATLDGTRLFSLRFEAAASKKKVDLVSRSFLPAIMATSNDKPPVTRRPSISEKELKLLKESGVPAISLHDACKACDDPCFDDDEDTHPDQVGFHPAKASARRAYICI